MKKVLKLENEYYIAVKNKENCQCAFEHNLGYCWLRANNHKCSLDCKKYRYDLLKSPLNNIRNIYDKILNIVTNTSVSDAISDEEKTMLLYTLPLFELDNWKSHIIDSRYLFNKTFAIRLYNFIKDLIPDNDEETQLLDECIEYAKELFNFQLLTCTEEDEISYMKNIEHITSDGTLILL